MGRIKDIRNTGWKLEKLLPVLIGVLTLTLVTQVAMLFKLKRKKR